MANEFTAVFEDGGDGWITAYVEEVPGAITQGRTIDEARVLLKEALELVLESNRELTRSQSSPDAVREKIAVDG